MRDLTLDDWKLVQDCIGVAAKSRATSAAYSAQPCVGSVRDQLSPVYGELLPRLAAVEEKVLDNIRALEPVKEPIDQTDMPF